MIPSWTGLTSQQFLDLNLTIREYSSFALAVGYAFLAWVFLIRLWVQFRANVNSGYSLIGAFCRLWRSAPTQGAIAILVMMAGASFYRAWIWLILKLFNDGADAAWVKDAWPYAAGSSLITIIGIICAIRVFAVRRAPLPPGASFRQKLVRFITRQEIIFIILLILAMIGNAIAEATP